MPILANARRERFAQELAKGKAACVAHKTAGYNGDRGTASKLQRDPSIVQRVEEIMLKREVVEEKATAAAIEELSIDRAWVLGRLVENVERSMQARRVKNADGEEMENAEYRYDGAVANKALELIGRQMGMFIEAAKGDTITNNFAIIAGLPSDAQRQLASLLELTAEPEAA